MEEERQDEEGRIASMSLLSAIQTKVGEQLGGRMYVETEVGGKKLQATVDTRADTVYVAKELADEIHLPYKKEGGLCQKESTRRACPSMKSHRVRTSKLDHEKVRSI